MAKLWKTTTYTTELTGKEVIDLIAQELNLKPKNSLILIFDKLEFRLEIGEAGSIRVDEDAAKEIIAKEFPIKSVDDVRFIKPIDEPINFKNEPIVEIVTAWSKVKA